ncbi:hypothetical protein L596_006075 [Steinernema carpocapsae]|uniref:non-specific serine/threonine protein kinase n=1 Tax=Steinernema carpocapsae TaxID=34508 RepID=A0A4U8V2D3_STECR|nr:hypothetical protein L596_006075 [Steinernema carpocapsae]
MMPASNLLLTISNDVKLCDFGVSLELSADDFEGEFSNENPSYYRITLLTAAPEALPDISTPRKFRPPYDIWSLGCVLVTMLTQTPPYFNECIDKSDNEMFKYLSERVDGGRHFSYDARNLIPGSSSEVQNLLESIMVKDEDERPTAKEILELDQIKLNARLCSVNPLSMGSKKRRQFSVDIDEITVDHMHHNGTVQSRKKKYVPLLGREMTVDSDECESDCRYTLEDSDSEKGENHVLPTKEKHESDLHFFFRFHMSRIFIFVSLLSKWSGMVFLSAICLAIVATIIFMAIYVIYRGIETVCGCDLNEGFVVLIALILLPIMILLTTLCCNNACEKYNQAVESGKIRKSRFFHGPPEKTSNSAGSQSSKAFENQDGKQNQRTTRRKKTIKTLQTWLCLAREKLSTRLPNWLSALLLLKICILEFVNP